MDKRKSIINIATSLIFKSIMVIMAVIVRKCLIKYVGNDGNGLNSLYINIINVVSIAELGIGSAITFSMYKPIVENDQKKVGALYNLYKKMYTKISLIIFIVGLLMMPLLPYFANDLTLNVNLYSTFFIFLISVVITYFYSAKSSLINAYKNNYITTIIEQSGQILLSILQIAVLIITHSFVWFLLVRILVALLQWFVTSYIADRKYKKVLESKELLDYSTTEEITKNIKAMFMHKIGGVLVNSSDNIIISSFVSVMMLGLYTNYTTIAISMISILGMFFSQTISIIGHSYISQSKQKFNENFEFFHKANFMIGIIFFLGFYACIDNLIELLYGKEFLIEKSLVAIITVNYYIQFMRQAALSFRDATGTFYYDRYKPFIEGIVNVVLSIIFVKVWGISGVIIATILTNIFICHIVEPYVLYKHALKKSPKKYYLKNYSFILTIIIFIYLYEKINIFSINNIYYQFLVNGLIAVGIALIPCIMIYIFDKKTRTVINKLLKIKRGGNHVKENTNKD